MFDRLLIANRGEIACRIIRTARSMGIHTIAVFSDADRDALHVKMADQAVHIGPAPASESYLRTDRILEAALKTGAQAIHPGYGFLSEQTDLIEGCETHGLIWVGPHIEAIRSMGSKIEAKQIALEAEVPCIPGYSGEDQSDEILINEAANIGLPVMIKASAGGGGKGMRAVFEANDLASAISSARQEAKRSFGDDRLLVEKLIQNPRHIEVQLLGDKHGNLVHLFERDCSVQRNHQKLLEEAPAPNLRNDTQQALFDAALKLGRKIGYDSAGTVEFIMDAASQDFYFLEMNTRLQVEHTVTEEITGLDLVEQQLRIASGETLSLAQEEIECHGHAIEARLTAEDVANDFRPETGTILHWKVDPTLRSDSGVEAGSSIGTHYDSMISKLIAHGTDRSMACKKLAKGLERLEVAGLKTNRLFLRDILISERFFQGLATTDFLARQWPEGWKSADIDSFCLAAIAQHCKLKPASTPWQTLGAYRLLGSSGCSAKACYIDASDPECQISIQTTDRGLILESETGNEEVEIQWLASDRMAITRDGLRSELGVLFDQDHVHLWSSDFEASHQVIFAGDFNSAQFEDSASSSDRILAPMPGLIVELPAQKGRRVEAGEPLLVMESMKLLTEVRAEASGIISDIKAATGEAVEAGQLLITLDLASEGAV
jgi:acetyl/propionyl-CoA carboxylase alpha subunit